MEKFEVKFSEKKQVAVSHGNYVTQWTFTPTKSMTRIQVLKLVEEARQRIQEKYGEDDAIKMRVVIKDKTVASGMGYRSGMAISITEKAIPIWTKENKDYAMTLVNIDDLKDKKQLDELRRDEQYNKSDITEVVIYITDTRRVKIDLKSLKSFGADDKNNDCVYNCLKEYPLILPWKSSGELKEYLGLARDAKIPMTQIPKIENKLNMYKINIYGKSIESSYMSAKKAKFTINLSEVEEGHLIVKEFNSEYLPKCATEDIGIHFYRFSEEEDKYYYARKNDKNEVVVRSRTRKEFAAAYNKAKSCKIQHIAFSEYHDVELKQEYEEFIRNVDEMKEKTGGKINMYKYGSVTNTILHVFMNMTKHIPFEFPSLIEQEYLSDAFLGGITYAKKMYTGAGYEYDFVSRYPAIMAQQQSRYPFCCGEFKTLTQKELDAMEYYMYGIYHVEISIKMHDNEIHKLFRFSKNNKYTHIDLEMARDMGFGIEVIDDGHPNFLCYTPEKLVNGNHIFSEYVGLIYKIKDESKTNVLAKQYLNKLYGLMAKKERIKMVIEPEYDITNIELDETFGMIPWNDNVKINGVDRTKRIFKYPFCRCSIFIAALGRKKLYDTVKVYMNDIVRIQTDGFVSKKELPLLLGTGIGQLKYVGYSDNITVFNCNKVIDNNTKEKFNKSTTKSHSVVY